MSLHIPSYAFGAAVVVIGFSIGFGPIIASDIHHNIGDQTRGEAVSGAVTPKSLCAESKELFGKLNTTLKSEAEDGVQYSNVSVKCEDNGETIVTVNTVPAPTPS